MVGGANDDVAAQVQQLFDIEAIKQLKARYIRFADCKNWDEWRELFTVDAQLDTEGGHYEGRDAIVAGVSRAMANAHTMHRVTMPEITFTGLDNADVIWGQQDFVEMEYKGQPLKFSGWGYYYEKYRRTPAGWRIASSRLERMGKLPT